jgi:hypothetical protein
VHSTSAIGDDDDREPAIDCRQEQRRESRLPQDDAFPAGAAHLAPLLAGTFDRHAVQPNAALMAARRWVGRHGHVTGCKVPRG